MQSEISSIAYLRDRDGTRAASDAAALRTDAAGRRRRSGSGACRKRITRPSTLGVRVAEHHGAAPRRAPCRPPRRGSAAAMVSPMITEPSAPRDLPPASASASSIRNSVSGGSAASRSPRPASRPVSDSQSATAAVQRASSCAKHPSNKLRLDPGVPRRSAIAPNAARRAVQATRSRRTRPSAEPSVPTPSPVANGRATCGPSARVLCGTDDPIAKNREKSTSQSSVSGMSCGRPVAGVADEVAQPRDLRSGR